MKRNSVYLAGPYSAYPTHYTNAAAKFAAHLRRHGFLPYCPHLLAFIDLISPMSNDDILDWCLTVLKTYPFDAVFVFDDGRSPGRDAEVALAEAMGIPVFYELADLIAWRDGE